MWVLHKDSARSLGCFPPRRHALEWMFLEVGRCCSPNQKLRTTRSMKGLFVTGQPSCGKTWLVNHLARLAIHDRPGLSVCGFITEEVCSSSGGRLGFDCVEVLTGCKRGVLARKGHASKYKTGEYGVDLESFEATALPQLGVGGDSSDSVSQRLVVVDEIGRMELHSQKFAQASCRTA